LITSTAIGTGGLGRFGNQLFTIAGVIGIADKNNQEFGFPEWKNYDNALFGGEVTDFSSHFVNPLPDLRGIDSRNFIEYGYFWGYRDVVLQMGNWSINAHLQSPKFFEHSIDKVRHYFTMKDELNHDPKLNNLCAVHYRAGDYIDNPEAYHPRQPIEYYIKAMSMMPEDTVFIAYSDDINRFYELLKGAGCHYRFRVNRGDETYLDDFRSMKACKNFIISNSSFSAMAAILADHPEKKVIAPKRWFGTQAGEMNWNDGYDKNWIVI
jgi:hypothetical protein